MSICGYRHGAQSEEITNYLLDNAANLPINSVFLSECIHDSHFSDETIKRLLPIDRS
jgi:hypothetical protein